MTHEEFLELEQSPPIGKYGKMAISYWKENKLVELAQLTIDGEYYDYFSCLDEQAFDLLEQVQKDLKLQTPPPKGNSFLEQAKYNNWLHSTAEEIVLAEIVYC